LELFVKKGVKETTIRDIAEAAGVAEGTLYRHYESKEALAEALFTESYEQMAVTLRVIRDDAPTFRRALDGMIAFFCRSFDEDWVLFSYLLLSQHRHLRDRDEESPSPYGVIREAIAEAMQKGEIARRDPDLATSMILGLVLQPAISKIYGRIGHGLTVCAPDLTGACWAVLTRSSEG
jgi:AcrR family transcriptional regulator